MELAQDLKAIHGLDVETELSNILSSEILAEINRGRKTVYKSAKKGASINTTTGIFDEHRLKRKMVCRKFKGLMFQIERDATWCTRNKTRKGNRHPSSMLFCTSNRCVGLHLVLNNNLH